MDRVTYYDMLAGCYKLKPDVSTNIIQRLGRLESDFDKLNKLLEEYEQDKINGTEAWGHVITTILE
jgi:hypothetical protein